MKTKLGISLVLALLAFIFITQNTDVVMVNFIAWSVEMSLVLLVFIMLGAGIIIGWLLSSYLRFVRNRKRVNEPATPDTQKVTQSDDVEKIASTDGTTPKEKEIS